MTATTNPRGSAFGRGDAPPTRTSACTGCGRDMSPGPGRHSWSERGKTGADIRVTPSGTCIYCLVGSGIHYAIPRARLLIRAGAVPVDPTIPAYGRGPSRRAARALRARNRRDAVARINQTGARSRARLADVVRSTQVEARRSQKVAA